MMVDNTFKYCNNFLKRGENETILPIKVIVRTNENDKDWIFIFFGKKVMNERGGKKKIPTYINFDKKLKTTLLIHIIYQKIYIYVYGYKNI